MSCRRTCEVPKFNLSLRVILPHGLSISLNRDFLHTYSEAIIRVTTHRFIQELWILVQICINRDLQSCDFLESGMNELFWEFTLEINSFFVLGIFNASEIFQHTLVCWKIPSGYTGHKLSLLVPAIRCLYSNAVYLGAR